MRANAAQVLGEIGPDARASVPALRRLLVCKHDFTREQAAIALWRITRDTNVVSLLVAELDRAPNSMAYRQIVSALGEMGQPAKAAVPAVVRTIGQPGRWEDFEQYEILKVGEEALRRIDPNALLKLNGPGK